MKKSQAKIVQLKEPCPAEASAVSEYEPGTTLLKLHLRNKALKVVTFPPSKFQAGEEQWLQACQQVRYQRGVISLNNLVGEVVLVQAKDVLMMERSIVQATVDGDGEEI